MKTSIKSAIRICRFEGDHFMMSSEHRAHITHFDTISMSGLDHNSLRNLANSEGVVLDNLHCKFVFIDDFYFGYHGSMLWAVYYNDKRLHLCWQDFKKYYDMVYDEPSYLDLLSNRIVMRDIFESKIYGQGNEVC